MQCRGPLGLSADHTCKNVSVSFSFLSSHRAKPAANNNDAGGMDESELEKMKQVIFFFWFLDLKKKKKKIYLDSTLVANVHLNSKLVLNTVAVRQPLFCRRSWRRCGKSYKKSRRKLLEVRSFCEL